MRNNNMISWDEVKRNISIIQVANQLGYSLLKGKTTSLRPVLRDENGDTIVIKNPNDFYKQLYYNPNNDIDRGSVIDFVKHRINQFNQSGYNEIDKINKIFADLMGRRVDFADLELKFNIKKAKKFDISDYKIENAQIDKIQYLEKERNISIDTLNTFLPYIKLISSNNNKYSNIGFPFYSLSDNSIKGFELRNFNFKSFSEGGDKSKAIWIANFAAEKALVRNIYIAESAIDAMSFYQLNKNRIENENSVFISTGGTVVKNQIQSIKDTFPNANIHCCFDNDLAGNLYDISLVCFAEGKELKKVSNNNKIEFTVDDNKFEIKKDSVNLQNFLKKANFETNIKIHKPIGFKDFNEVIQNNTMNKIKKPVIRRKNN